MAVLLETVDDRIVIDGKSCKLIKTKKKAPLCNMIKFAKNDYSKGQCHLVSTKITRFRGNSADFPRKTFPSITFPFS